MDPSELLFTKQQRCGLCEEAIHQGDNWGCVNTMLEIFGGVGAIHVHKHVHIRCATGYVKWLALGALGRATRELN